MDILESSAILGTLVVSAFVVGIIVSYFGMLPHVGYVVTGILAAPLLEANQIVFVFHFSLAILLAYLGYMASSRRLLSAPFQLLFIHPLRLAVGFALFFTFLSLMGMDVVSALPIAVLLSTSSAIVVRWGRSASYSLIENSILSLDALISALTLLYLLREPITGILAVSLMYLAAIFVPGVIPAVLLVVLGFSLAFSGVLSFMAFSFLVGVVLHHVFYDVRMHWVEGAFHDVLPIVFLMGIGLFIGPVVTPLSVAVLLLILVLSFLQNFISLVVLGPIFGVSPKTGAHILARTLGPSEAVLFASFLAGSPLQVALAVFWFYFVAVVFSSFVRTEKDAERLLSRMFPSGLFRTIERLEEAYAAVFLRHHVVFSDAYRRLVAPYVRRIVAGVLVLLVSVSMLVHVSINPEAPHRVLTILLSTTAFLLAVIKMVNWYVRVYDESLEFISEHAYSGKLRVGKSHYYLIAGYILTILGFVTIPVSIPSLNLVFLFLSLLMINMGLYMLLNNYAKIYREFVHKRDYVPG